MSNNSFMDRSGFLDKPRTTIRKTCFWFSLALGLIFITLKMILYLYFNVIYPGFFKLIWFYHNYIYPGFFKITAPTEVKMLLCLAILAALSDYINRIFFGTSRRPRTVSEPSDSTEFLNGEVHHVHRS